jgi:hypothetical protein
MSYTTSNSVPDPIEEYFINKNPSLAPSGSSSVETLYPLVNPQGQTIAYYSRQDLCQAAAKVLNANPGT